MFDQLLVIELFGFEELGQVVLSIHPESFKFVEMLQLVHNSIYILNHSEFVMKSFKYEEMLQ